jgi:hypothetical protein
VGFQVNVPGAYAPCAAGPSVSEAGCRLEADKIIMIYAPRPDQH